MTSSDVFWKDDVQIEYLFASKRFARQKEEAHTRIKSLDHMTEGLCHPTTYARKPVSRVRAQTPSRSTSFGRVMSLFWLCHYEKSVEQTADADQPQQTTNVTKIQTPTTRGAFVDLPARRLFEKTLRKFNYTVDNEGKHYAPYYDKQGKVVAQKVRTPDKDFYVNRRPQQGWPVRSATVVPRPTPSHHRRRNRLSVLRSGHRPHVASRAVSQAAHRAPSRPSANRSIGSNSLRRSSSI